MHTYLELLRDVLKNGEFKEDRTGTGTYSKFGAQLRFNLAEGFPLVTTKKVHIKSIIHELLWFLRGDTNSRNLEAAGVNIWKEWSDESGDLHKIYGRQWRRWVVKCPAFYMDKRVAPPNGEFEPPQNRGMPVIDTGYDDLVGTVLRNNKGQEFKVLENEGATTGNSRYRVQYTATTTVCTHTRPNIRAGCAEDPYGVGELGTCVGRPGERAYYERAYDLWHNMVSRCRKLTHPMYKSYGAKGVYVVPRWLCFEYFLADLSTLPQYEEWLSSPESYCLDKDYYGAGAYGPTTCVFLHQTENKAYSAGKTPVIITVGGKDELFVTCKDAAEAYGLEHRRLGEQLRGQRVVYPEIQIRHANVADKVIRKIKFVDQISWLINEIRTNPDSRRLIVSAWNPGEVDKMALPPCHVMAQFYVSKGKLSCMLTQRSGDLFLGVPFNIASYALLTMMIAQVCGLKLGEFIHSLGDAHIYKNHVLQVNEQLSREPKWWPTMVLNPEVKDIFDFKYEDFTLLNYNPHPAISAPVAV